MHKYADDCAEVRRTTPDILCPTAADIQRRAGDIARRTPRLVRNFKMAIHGAGERLVADEEGRMCSVRRLVADYLREVGTLSRAYLRRGRDASALPDAEIVWCLTVPAIWSEADKGFMRRAAVEAGLIGSEDDERLMLILEPEAAAVCCLKDQRVSPPEGENFMLIDAGGGTVDITVHRLTGGQLREVVRGSGAMCGATMVDAQFDLFIEGVLGKAIFHRLRHERPGTWLEMRQSWESAKRDFTGSTFHTFYLPIPTTLGRLIERDSPGFFAELAAKQGGIDDTIVLDAARMDAIFRPVLAGVVKAIEYQFELLRAAKQPCTSIVLVGGFAESGALQQSVRSAFGGRVRRVLVPERPGSTIVIGAAHLGFDASRIGSRRARMTYGCDFAAPFEPGVDPEGSRNVVDGVARCLGRFSSFVVVGQELTLNQCVTNGYVTIYPGQNRMNFGFYATASTVARYVDGPDVQRIGELTIALKDPVAGKGQRAVEVKMYFGRSEIRVEAIDVQSGIKTKCLIEYDW